MRYKFLVKKKNFIILIKIYFFILISVEILIIFEDRLVSFEIVELKLYFFFVIIFNVVFDVVMGLEKFLGEFRKN